jgi:hypothetical protein
MELSDVGSANPNHLAVETQATYITIHILHKILDARILMLRELVSCIFVMFGSQLREEDAHEDKENSD